MNDLLYKILKTLGFILLCNALLSACSEGNNYANPIESVPDQTAPVLDIPDDITAEATGLETPIFLGTATAIDSADSTVNVLNDAPEYFSLGVTIVTYTATDLAGNIATATQQVLILDSTPPILTPPTDIQFESPDGNPVSGFIGLATANDLVDGITPITHDAPTLFPIGTTVVTYTSTDAAGNTATATQNITVVYANAPAIAAIPSLSFTSTKGFQFDWLDVHDATFYRLLENQDGVSGFSQLGMDILSNIQTITEIVPLYQRLNAQYILQSCNPVGCTDSSPISVIGNLVDSIGELTSNNNGTGDRLGTSVSLSSDGTTLAVGAPREDSITTGINGSGDNNKALQSGAVYIFIRNGLNWTQQAYIKASNTDLEDYFGTAVSLSNDGNTLAVGAYLEDSNATGVNNNSLDNSATDSGAAYVFTRTSNSWAQHAYIKASNTDAGDYFGEKVSLSGDGTTLAIGAYRESSSATGINGNEADNSLSQSGAVYLYKLITSTWVQEAYIKATNTGLEDRFGTVSLSQDGNTLAIGAYRERSSASGVDGNQNDDGRKYSGAVYLFTRSGTLWTQQHYIKASSPDTFDYFGFNLSLSGDATTLAVGAYNNDSSAIGINGSETDNAASNSGAAYVFVQQGATWVQQAFIKASNTDTSDTFGWSLTLSNNGDTLAVGAYIEDSNATGLNGNQADNSTSNAGAVYVFKRNASNWTQQAYIKNITIESGRLGYSVSLSSDSNTLAIGAERQSPGGAVLLY